MLLKAIESLIKMDLDVSGRQGLLLLQAYLPLPLPLLLGELHDIAHHLPQGLLGTLGIVVALENLQILPLAFEGVVELL